MYLQYSNLSLPKDGIFNLDPDCRQDRFIEGRIQQILKQVQNDILGNIDIFQNALINKSEKIDTYAV